MARDPWEVLTRALQRGGASSGEDVRAFAELDSAYSTTDTAEVPGDVQAEEGDNLVMGDADGAHVFVSHKAHIIFDRAGGVSKVIGVLDEDDDEDDVGIFTFALGAKLLADGPVQGTLIKAEVGDTTRHYREDGTLRRLEGPDGETFYAPDGKTPRYTLHDGDEIEDGRQELVNARIFVTRYSPEGTILEGGYTEGGQRKVGIDITASGAIYLKSPGYAAATIAPVPGNARSAGYSRVQISDIYVEDWRPLQLLNGWTPMPNQYPPEYRMDASGLVTFRGLVAGGNTTDGFRVGQVEGGYRLQKGDYFMVNNARTPGYLRLMPDNDPTIPGGLTINAPSMNNTWINLNTISYYADA